MPPPARRKTQSSRVDAVYDQVVAALAEQDGFCLDEKQTDHLESVHWHRGKLTNALLAKDIDIVLAETGLDGAAPQGTRFLVALQQDIDREHPMTGEKMARFLALYRASDFEDAVERAVAIQSIQGAGHSLGLHSADDSRAHRLAMETRTCRVIVNQAHCFATGGFFNNGLPFSLSMGCGSWGGNSIDGNLNWEHFVNKVVVARTIEENRPSLDEIFSDYWENYGK